MAKQDVLDAINATIVENGQKGITAQALNNVLTMMTENAGEGGGSGDGVLRIMIPTGVTNGEMTEFTPENWNEIVAAIESEIPGCADILSPIGSEIFTHNAMVYQQLLEKRSNEEGVLCILDGSKMVSVLKKYILSEILEVPVERIQISQSEIAHAFAVRMDVTDDESIDVVSIIAINPAPSYYDNYFEDTSVMGGWGAINLYSDGSMTLFPRDTIIYVPRSEDATLPDDYKSMNEAVFQYGALERVTNIRYVDSDGGPYITMGKVLACDLSNNILFYAATNILSTAANALAIYKVVVSRDGSVTNTLVSNLVSA